MEPRLNAPKGDTVSLECAKGDCCPDVTFNDNGSVSLSDMGQIVSMTPESARKLCEELVRRGYGK